MPKTPSSFGLRLKMVRERVGVTQEELAERIGVNTSMIGRYESAASTNPTLAVVERLAKALGVRVRELTDPDDPVESVDEETV